jgi:hypothetical protein
MLGLSCLSPLLEVVNALIKFAQRKYTFIYDFVAIIKSFQVDIYMRFCWCIWWTSATLTSLLQILHCFLICDSYWIHSSFHNNTDLLQRLICSYFNGEPIRGYIVLNVSLLHTSTFWLFLRSICFCKLLVTTLDIYAYYHIIKISTSWDNCISSSKKKHFPYKWNYYPY